MVRPIAALEPEELLQRLTDAPLTEAMLRQAEARVYEHRRVLKRAEDLVRALRAELDRSKRPRR